MCVQRAASLRDFVTFWEQTYYDKNEVLYVQNINRAQSMDNFLKLFQWKMGDVYFKTPKMLQSVKENFIKQIEKARRFPPDVPAKDFLEEFPKGGAIYSIFWLHCWYPERFPIYDQHVHRAMTFIRDGKLEELDQDREKTIKSYLEEYLPFYGPFGAASKDLPFDEQKDGVRGRKADRALWAFGKYLRTRWANGICELHP